MVKDLLARWLGAALDTRIAGLEKRLKRLQAALRRSRHGSSTNADLALRWRSIADGKDAELEAVRDERDEALLRIQELQGDLSDVRRELGQWDTGYAAAERWFDNINEPDEVWGDREEARAIGAAGYRMRLRQAFADAEVPS